MTIDKQELQRLCDAASPGPWTAYGCYVEGPSLNIYDEGGHTEADAEFIAAARTAIPELLAELAAVTAERDEMCSILSDLKGGDYASIAGFSPITLYLRRRMQEVIAACEAAVAPVPDGYLRCISADQPIPEGWEVYHGHVHHMFVRRGEIVIQAKGCEA